jgi:protease-4
MQTYEVTDLAKKIGVNLINYKSSSLKSAPNPFEKINPDVDMVISQQINDVYDYFLNIFVERRKIKITEAQEIANGQVYTGRQALEYGLIDKIGTEEDALSYFKDNSIDVDNMAIVDFNIYKKNNKFSILNNFINSKISNTINGVMAIYNN